MRYVGCPRCGTQIAWSRDNPFRPFCSERCKMTDLGAWATEEYRVPASDEKQPPEDADQETAPARR